MRTHSDRDLRMLVARSSHLGHHVPLNLAGADLEMANLPHVDLRGANLMGANLRGAMLWGARLDNARLDGADLSCANLTWSDLPQCSMKGTLLVEADLSEALVDNALSDAVTEGADMMTINFTVQALGRMQELSAELRSRGEGPEELVRKKEAKCAHDEAIWRAYLQSAPPSLRKRGAAGFKIYRSELGCTGDRYEYKREQLERAQGRVLSDVDLQELLRWSASTGKPLNLRGCNLSGANLRNASLRGACLAFTVATGADIHGVDLVGADLRDSCGWERPKSRSRDVVPTSGPSVTETSPVRPWWKFW
jgi:uncharacterized protein YjbI with pentapeptide repeats